MSTVYRSCIGLGNAGHVLLSLVLHMGLQAVGCFLIVGRQRCTSIIRLPLINKYCMEEHRTVKREWKPVLLPEHLNAEISENVTNQMLHSCQNLISSMKCKVKGYTSGMHQFGLKDVSCGNSCHVPLILVATEGNECVEH